MTTWLRRPTKAFRRRVDAAWKWQKDHRDGLRFGVEILTLIAVGLYALIAHWQWGISCDQLNLMTVNGQRELRAYLLFHSGDFTKKDSEHYDVVVRVKNSGTTPAYNIRHSWDAGVFESPPPAASGSGPIAFQPVKDIPHDDAGGGLEFPLGDGKRLTITQAEADEIRARRKVIYVWANIEYRDTFQAEQRTQFIAVNEPGETPSGWRLRSYQHWMNDTHVPASCTGSWKRWS